MKDEHFELDEYQRLAIDQCCDCSAGNRIVAVTGAAGTGKTTIIKQVYDTLIKAGYSVVLVAPTGKAAKRIYEATGIRASTIHRLLEYPHPGERDDKTGEALESTTPKRKKSNPLEHQIVIADEYAMVNLEVHTNLVAAMPKAGRLLMFGDVFQLKPIERHRLIQKESPFEQAIRRFNGVKLRKVHRYGTGSGIAKSGKLILAGSIPRRFDDFILRITQKPVDSLKEYVLQLTEQGVNFGSITEQIIVPVKASWVGTYQLNKMLQDTLNPMKSTDRTPMPRNKWDSKTPISIGVGDKVIWTANNYDLRSDPDNYIEDDKGRRQYTATPSNLQIMNGETGIVEAIHPDGSFDIDCGDRTVNVPVEVLYDAGKKKGLITYDPRKSVDLAYVITTHKSQGSEYNNVVYVLNKSNFMMQCRPNFYTAITRAKECACVISDQRSLGNSVAREFNLMESRNR